ncbi:transcriptional regulator, LacI family [Paraburkholderia fungorum]|uniref:Transcriptional regulator, LacI family n=1 Tax=Paraburkholderia fungorum TaxID=134537 RepID=A0A1H1K0H2_9BURK|nr:LacI family DNA-binding transcriptional regulator [Paraburkholderia fungorum]SDR55500.1 transcriptional regulator, LacI family [Paraburkholderia fungorum]
MTRKYTTLEDVALAAGMSRAQVSRALRGDPGVKPETREHVAQVAKTLGYQPNIAARALVSAQPDTVGIIIGEPTNPFHIQLAQAIDAELQRVGLDSVVSLRAQDDPATLREGDRLLRLRVAGVILISKPRNKEALAALAEQLPCVYLGKRVNHSNVSTIDIDDKSGVEQAIGHLIALGHRRIAHLAGTVEISARERTAAYRAAMRHAGLAANVVMGTHDVASGRRGVDTLAEQGEFPTAIFASNDAIALGAIDRLKGRGLRVPEDVSVIGFDDIPDATSEMLALTTVRQDVDQQAREAVAALQLLAFSTVRKVIRKVLPVSLVVRRSAGPPRN